MADWILWYQLRKALKHILISVLSIYLKLSTCLSADLSRNTCSDCSLVLFSLPSDALFSRKMCECCTINSFWAWHFMLSPMNWEEILEEFIRHFPYSLLLLLVNFTTFSFKTERLSWCFWREVGFVWFREMSKCFTDLPIVVKRMLPILDVCSKVFHLCFNNISEKRWSQKNDWGDTKFIRAQKTVSGCMRAKPWCSAGRRRRKGRQIHPFWVIALGTFITIYWTMVSLLVFNLNLVWSNNTEILVKIRKAF